MIIFKLILAIFILCIKINIFNYLLSTCAVSGVNATETRPLKQFLVLNTEVNIVEIWDASRLINTQWCINLSFMLFFITTYLNYRLYSRKSIKSCRIIKTRFSMRCKRPKADNTKSKKNSKELFSKLILITFFKCLLMAIIFLAIKQKQSPKQKNKFSITGYLLSVEHYRDCYHLSELQIKSNMEWFAMSKLKFKNFNSYFHAPYAFRRHSN